MKEQLTHELKDKTKRTEKHKLLGKKPFATIMYRWILFIIAFYARVRQQLKIDYDSFIIIQTTASHALYHLNKKNINKKEVESYEELDAEWDKIANSKSSIVETLENKEVANLSKLTISSICLVAGLPKETVRRKVNMLVKKGLLKSSQAKGIQIGTQYKKIFNEFVPVTAKDLVKMLKAWEKSGVLKKIINSDL